MSNSLRVVLPTVSCRCFMIGWVMLKRNGIYYLVMINWFVNFVVQMSHYYILTGAENMGKTALAFTVVFFFCFIFLTGRMLRMRPGAFKVGGIVFIVSAFLSGVVLALGANSSPVLWIFYTLPNFLCGFWLYKIIKN